MKNISKPLSIIKTEAKWFTIKNPLTKPFIFAEDVANKKIKAVCGAGNQATIPANVFWQPVVQSMLRNGELVVIKNPKPEKLCDCCDATTNKKDITERHGTLEDFYAALKKEAKQGLLHPVAMLESMQSYRNCLRQAS